MKKLIIPIIAFIGLGTNVFAQSTTTSLPEKSKKEIKGDNYYFVYSFDKAINSYSSEKELTLDGQRKLAKSYFNMNQNALSEEAYAKLINTPGGNLSEDIFNYAMVLRSDAKYDESNKQMDKFAEMKPNDLRAKDYVTNRAELPTLLSDNGKYRIEHPVVNTDAEDFAPSYFKNKIVFASSRTMKMNPRKSNRNGKPFLNLYMSEVVDSVTLKMPDNFDKSMNGKMNDGPASFNKEGTFMASTQNNYDLKRKELVVRLEIYFRTYADGKWSKEVPFILNSKEYSVGQACLSANGNTMYFVSDMPGGFGATDIYKITKDEKGTWGKAENLGDKINTEGDEMFPFFEENTGTLFFASNGRFGLGGMDIFISKANGTSFDQSVNAGSPLNTQYDDFAVIVDDKMHKGYFSSNKTGGSGDDDIYAFQILDLGKKIQGFAKDKNGYSVPRSFVMLQDDKGNMLDTLTTKDDGAYTFLVDTDKNFKLIGKKETYVDGDTLTNSFGKELIVKADVILLKKEEFVAKKIEVGADLAKILEYNQPLMNHPIYFDLDKSNLRPDAIVELKNIVKIMNDYPEMIVELGAYADCRAPTAYNQTLSDKRAKVSAWYVKSRITNPGRIYGKGYGETKLVSGCACEGDVVSTCSEEEFQKDRRTEFIIVKKISVKKTPLSAD